MIIKVQRFYRHHNYRVETLDYDYSLAKLEHPLQFSESIRPIALPAANARISERTIEGMCIVSGWGKK